MKAATMTARTARTARMARMACAGVFRDRMGPWNNQPNQSST